MKTTYLFLARGFEETEAIATVDLLRRAEIDVKIVSITGKETVTGAHNIKIKADVLMPDVSLMDAQAMILPGGMPGAEHLLHDADLRLLLSEFHKSGGVIAAICAAPMVLGDLGILRDKKATCYPGFEKFLIGAEVTGNKVEVDGNIITGKGPAFAFDFGLAIITKLTSVAKAEEVASGFLLA
ncbi:DJ-1 family glyoxalase III [Porphyromonas pogonae]|uniref:DJ-1 family glyoxalase III n=1 Tax=Porphyromonas pogonae TaxID=867595 RepID=UPI002E78AAE5|nr:DJ-1 family glyoxalase III [Porphyromonas pogonae]